MCAGIMLANLLAYSIPYFLKLIADTVVEAKAVYVLGDFSYPLIAIAVIALGSELLFRGAHLLQIEIEYSMYHRLMTRLYGFVLHRSASFFEERFSGGLARRLDKINDRLRSMINTLTWEVGWQLGGIIMCFVLLAGADWHLLAVFTVWLAYFLVVSYFLLPWEYKATAKAADAYAALSGTIVDTLVNVQAVQYFAAHEHEYRHYNHFMHGAIRAGKKEAYVGFLNTLHQGLSAAILTIALTLASVLLFIRGAITVGDLVVVASILPIITGVVWSLGRTVVGFIKEYSEIENSLLSLRVATPQVVDGPQTLEVREPSIEFSNVTFAYAKSKRTVLQNFSLKINAGEKVGLVGTSGAGKSTVIKLLLRSYEPQEGSVSVSGTLLSDLTLKSLRTSITYVPQETFLFNRTLRENIIYAKPGASEEELVAACTRAHAHEFILSLPHGYDTLVGERGMRLSGGQRQRIALARAMLKNTPILVLDEATSALDTQSEMTVQQGLNELFEGKTVLAIAHRLSTLREMDRIIVLDGGQVVEDGTPSELLAKASGVFKQLWEHQKSGFIEDEA